MTFNKLKSNKGVLLSLIAYPILILLAAFSLGTFLKSMDGINQAKIHMQSLQAQYMAYEGMEYAYNEIMNQYYSGTTFMTHNVDSASNLLTTASTAPTARITGTYINTLYSGEESLVYAKKSTPGNSNSNGFEVKIYKKDNCIYILAKGTYGGRTRLFVNRLSATALYDYFIYSPYWLGLGRGVTFDAGGSKIVTNGGLGLGEGAKLSNVKEISALAGLYTFFSPYVKPGQEDYIFTHRFPWVWPADYNKDNPLTDNVHNIGIYKNSSDGHYIGDRYGLYMKGADGITYSKWDKTGPPVPVSIDDTPGAWIPGTPQYEKDVNNPNFKWDNFPTDGINIYQQSDVNCRKTFDCADGKIHNERYNSDLPNINGVYIPNRFPTSYPAWPYWGSQSTDPQISINALNSSKQLTDITNFFNSFPVAQPGGTYTVTGLKDVLKLTPTTAQYVDPPVIEINDLAEAAAKSGNGIAISRTIDSGNPSNQQILIEINGGTAKGGQTITLSDTKDAQKICNGVGTVFQQKTFINDETGLTTKALEINIKNLIACEAANSGKWLPKNNIIVSDYNGVVLTGANQLPDKGLTTIVINTRANQRTFYPQGMLILKGSYNSPDPNDLTWHWQPSAAIVDGKTYLVSDSFNYPTKLTYPQHHSNYPYSQIITSNGTNYTLPAGMAEPACPTCAPGTSYDRDYVAPTAVVPTGFNWLYHYDSKMANKVTDIQTTLYFDISFIAPYGLTTPRFLERWSYYNDPGTDSTPPADWKSYNAVVIGSFISLELTRWKYQDGWLITYDNNSRECDQNPVIPNVPNDGYSMNTIYYTDLSGTPFNAANYPCRQNTNPDTFWPGRWDLLSAQSKPNLTMQYQSRYIDNPLRPPGDLLGLYQSDVLELDANNAQNWTYHNATLFPKRYYQLLMRFLPSQLKDLSKNFFTRLKLLVFWFSEKRKSIFEIFQPS